MILSFFYWNNEEQNKKKKAQSETKAQKSISSPSKAQYHQPSQQYRKQVLEDEYQKELIKRQSDGFQPKIITEAENIQNNYVQIGIKAQKRRKSQTQRWQNYEMENYYRGRSEQRFEASKSIQGTKNDNYYEFDDLDQISDDKADLCIRNLPSNSLMKKLTI